MDNIWRHSDKRNTMTSKGKVTQCSKIITTPITTIMYIYDSNRKGTEDEAEMGGRHMMMIFLWPLRDAFSLISKLSWSIKVGCQQLEDGHMVEFQLLVFWSHPLVAMHHGKYKHQAFLESTVLIGSASSRRHKCETTVSPAGPNTVWINAGAAEPL